MIIYCPFCNEVKGVAPPYDNPSTINTMCKECKDVRSVGSDH